MSTPESMTPGAILGAYKLTTRLGNSVWQAEDSRSGRIVALKILANRLPADQAKREAAIRDVRLAAAFKHTNIATIEDIAAAGDALVMVMPLLDALPVTASRIPCSKETLFRTAWQVAAALRLLHERNIVHGNLNGDSVMLTPEGEVKLVGINLTNLLPRREGARALPADTRKVAYLAPEQIRNEPLDAKTDIYSAGVVFYQLATGRLPFDSNNPAELAQKIVSEPPASPKSANASIDAAVMGILGRCLFKDPSKRYGTARLIADEVERLDPDVPRFAERIAQRAAIDKVEPVAAPSVEDSREMILFLADVANYDEIRQRDPEAAAKTAARMQQILSEAVYLFDGRVIDPFGPRMIAELPSVESALEAARKGAFDLAPDPAPGVEILHVRLLLHAGPVLDSGGVVSGEAIEKAASVLPHLQPLQLFITEDFVKLGRGNARLRDSAARAGVKLFTIVEPENEFGSSASSADGVPIADSGEPGAVADESVTPVAAPRKRGALPFIAAAVAIVVLLAVGFVMWQKRPAAEAPAAQVAAAAPVAAKSNQVFVGAIDADPSDPSLAPRAETIRLATIELLRRTPGVELSAAADPGVLVISGELRPTSAGAEFSASGGGETSPAVPAADAAAAIRTLLDQVSRRSSAKVTATMVPGALNAFADAVAARTSNDAVRTEAALRTAMTSDPAFLPAQLMAMEYFSKAGNQKDALDAAKNVFAADPSNLEAARSIARAALSTGELQRALGAYGAILRKAPGDAEALNVRAQYALASGDPALFANALKTLATIPQRAVVIHEPDSLVFAGKIESAINKYYDIEVQQPDNPALALKIGRISVLRRSLAIAELELKKLEQLDPIYGLSLLRAYVLAEKQDRAGALQALAEAEKAAQPVDNYWTNAAEVHAILADNSRVIAALEKAAARKEPTGGYILNNPIFRYLANDARFEKVAPQFRAQQEEIRTALAQMPR